jgi:hypothetical protein
LDSQKEIYSSVKLRLKKLKLKLQISEEECETFAAVLMARSTSKNQEG